MIMIKASQPRFNIKGPHDLEAVTPSKAPNPPRVEETETAIDELQDTP